MRNLKLPTGWTWTRLDEVVEVLDNKRVPVSAKQRAERLGPVPYYGATGQVGWIDVALFDEELILLGEDGVQFFDRDKKKAYRISGPAWVNNHAHVLRAREGVILTRLLVHYLNSFNFEGYANGTTRLKLTKSSMNSIPVPLPPLAEQYRIVEALEDHLSRLDAACDLMVSCAQRTKAWLPRIMKAELQKPAAPLARLDELAEVRLGRQRSPKNHSGDQMRPYLRAANVSWEGLLLEDVKEMNFTDRETEIYRLQAGDIVLSEASGSAGEVGKPAIWSNEIEDCCFQNTLIRVRPGDNIYPSFLLYFLRSEALSGSFRKDTRGVGIHHLGASKLAAWKIPVPSLQEQIRTVEVLEEKISRLDKAHALLRGPNSALAKAESLRASLLCHAFSGRLTTYNSSDESDSILHDKISKRNFPNTKNETSPADFRSSVTSPESPLPPTLATTNAVQQELPL